MPEAAPLKPFYIYAQLTDDEPGSQFPEGVADGGAQFYELRPIYVVPAGGFGPRVTGIAALAAPIAAEAAIANLAESVPTDATTTIEITGENFTAASEVVLIPTPGVTLGPTEFVSATTLRVPVIVRRNARTGQTLLFVRTGETRSTQVPLLIADQSGRSILSGVFPNQVRHRENTEIVLTGENFEAGSMLVNNVVGNPDSTTRQPVPRDRLNTAFLADGGGNWSLESPRGLADGVIAVREILSGGLGGAGLKAQRITAIAGQVVPGTVGQLLVTTNGEHGPTPTAVHRPTELGGTVMSNLVTKASPFQTDGIPGQKFVVHFEAAATPILGPHQLAFTRLKNGFFLSSNLRFFTFVAPRANGALVRRTTTGEIEQGQTGVMETIEGENLDGATALRFASDGISATIPPGQVSPTQLQVLLTTTADAELTGEALTTFQVITRTHGTSNHAGYLVIP